MNPRLLPAAAALVLAAAPAAAQQPAARTLSLSEALGIARENNPDYRKKLAEVQTADADRRRALGALFPTLTLNASTGGYRTRTSTGRDQFGRPVSDTVRIIEGSNARQSLSLGDLTLFDGGARLRELRAAEAGADASRSGVAAEELRLVGEVTRRYYAALRSQQAIALEERLLQSARESLEATRQLLRVGVRSPVDVLGAEVKIAEAEQAVERARAERRQAELDLRQQMGMFGSEPLALTGSPPAVFDPAGLDADALVARALDTSPRIDRVDAGLRAADQRLGAARAARWPTLSLGASVYRNQNFEGYRGLYETSPRDQTLDVGFSLSFPLFNQFRTTGAIAQARAGRLTAEVDARAERLAVERDVRASLVELENAWHASRAAERTLALARERLEMASQQYRLGSVSFTDLQDSVEGAARAERDALSARFDFAAALATLEEKVGGGVGM